MTNPVRQLLRVLEEWEVSNKHAWGVRQADENSHKFWREYGELIALMREVEARIEQIELLGLFGPVLIRVWNTLVLPRYDWAARVGTTLNDSDYIALQTLASLIDTKGLASSFTLQDATAIRESLDEIRQIIWTIDDITEEFKEYIDDLITECISILNGENPDPDLARALAFQVIGATASISDVMTEEQREKILPRIRRLSAVLTSGFASGAGSRLAHHGVDAGINMVLGAIAGG